jgi:hypothetical protein
MEEKLPTPSRSALSSAAFVKHMHCLNEVNDMPYDIMCALIDFGINGCVVGGGITRGHAMGINGHRWASMGVNVRQWASMGVIVQQWINFIKTKNGAKGCKG